MKNSASQVSTLERWTEAQARRTVLSSIAAVIILGVAVIATVIRDPAMWPILFIWAGLVVSEWERVGFKQLLIRREAEIDELRSRLESV